MLLCVLWLLARLDANVTHIARFDFLWDVLSGAAAGVVFCLLPVAGGFGARRNVRTSMLWLPAFFALVVIFYQYAVLVTGLESPPFRFLLGAGTRLRMVEGAAVGYCAAVAARGKI